MKITKYQNHIGKITIKEIRKKSKHIDIRNTVQDSNPSNQKLANIGIQDIHALSQQWYKFFNTM